MISAIEERDNFIYFSNFRIKGGQRVTEREKREREGERDNWKNTQGTITMFS